MESPQIQQRSEESNLQLVDFIDLMDGLSWLAHFDEGDSDWGWRELGHTILDLGF